ncbi:hypothetical protein L3X38_037553 [Prunus dulcis]|uniref:Uncharacterized protein n=1 Tax=Prunus dulcis TaxID=3755 RepID=A0AAD4V4W9_PRUDU|nr:hypothetical protein L3X38_037553 [Prunus dulcis]
MAGSGAAELRTPVFNGENHEFWSIRMKTILKSHGLWDLVENGLNDSDMKKEKEEAAETEKSMVAQILMKDARALGLIQSAVSDQLFPRIVNEETSKGAWDILKLEFRGDKQVRNVKLQGLRREFEYTGMKDSESLSIYLVRLFNLMNQMRSYGEELSRERIVHKLLFSLPKSYDSICSVIEHSKDLETLEVQEVVASLKSFELRLDRHTENSSESAFASKPKCHGCGKFGHMVRDCNGNRNAHRMNYANEMEETDTLFYVCNAATDVKVNHSWYIDSGCSNHMTGDEGLLVNIQRNLTSKVKMGTGEVVPVAGKGTLVIKTKLGKKHIQESLGNLIVRVQMTNNRCFPLTMMPASELALRASVSHCLQTGTRDICGPMKTDSISGNKYFLLFTDDCTRMSWVYFIRNKSNALECFRKFKAMTELQSGYKIKGLRSDRGGEFLSSEFNSFCAEVGIQRQLTVAYSPQQNGVAERKNRTVVEMAKSMLHEKCIPYEFWAEAVNTAVYLLNRCPTKALNRVIPFEAFTGRKPGVAHLKIFGSPCHVLIPSALRHKLEENSHKCIFVGYGLCEKGYRLFDPSNRKIILSRDVKFDEESLWKWDNAQEGEITVPMPAENQNCEPSLDLDTPLQMDAGTLVQDEPSQDLDISTRMGENTILQDGGISESSQAIDHTPKKWRSVHRGANKAADVAASRAKRRMCDKVWESSLPFSLVFVVQVDGLLCPPTM